MQTLDIISVNVWQILISLVNLLLLFLIIKKFLFKPVMSVLEKRRQEIDGQYAEADAAIEEANLSKKQWEEKLAGAEGEAEAIIQTAAENAKYRGDKLIEEAQKRAESIIRVAESEAELERKKATDSIKQEIVEVSGALAEKLLERELNREDHKAIIESFIEEIGDGND